MTARTRRVVKVRGERWELRELGRHTYAQIVERDGTPAGGGWRYVCPCDNPRHSGPHGRIGRRRGRRRFLVRDL